MSDNFKKDFMISHFFNPVRFMELLELVVGPETSKDAVDMVQHIGDVHLGKKVVVSHDTPGFIGNRIGTFMIQRAIAEAMDNNLKIEEVDAALGRGVGFPKDGIFGLMDIVGLDLGPKVTGSLDKALPAWDSFHALLRTVPALDKLIAEGKTGRKSAAKEGFYRMVKSDDGSKKKQVVDLKTGEYRDAEKISFESADAGRDGLRQVFEHGDRGSQIAWNVLRDTLVYSANTVGEIADDIHSIDIGMRAGYNWKYGPFEMIDRVGTDWFTEKLKAENIPVPKILEAAAGRPLYRIENGKRQMMTTSGSYANIPQADGILDLDSIKRSTPAISSNDSASLWDIGDGAVCLELHGPKNTLDPDVMKMINHACAMIPASGGKYKTLVITSNDKNFAVGANLALAAGIIGSQNWDLMESVIAEGQQAMQNLKFAPFPVVAAVGGMALGGGCEIPLHCDAIQAHAETYIGLVETGVGIVPAWGGCKEFLLRASDAADKKGPSPAVNKAFEAIMMPQNSMSSSAHTAKQNLWLRKGDGISMNRDRLLSDAKARALSMVPGYTPPQPRTLRLPGAGGKAALSMAIDGFHDRGETTPYDVVVADRLAWVLTGGDTDHTKMLSETDILALERQAFMTLAKSPGTLARIKYTVSTGKPLREPLSDQSAREIRANLPSLHTPKDITISLTPPTIAAPMKSQTAYVPNPEKMKPADAVIHILQNDGWMPESPATTPELVSTFNEAAHLTKTKMISGLAQVRSTLKYLPSGMAKSKLVEDFTSRVGKAENKLVSEQDSVKKVQLQATIAVMNHYRDELEKLKF
jgi:3-hydroxyacyl-CoA dehydrogenase